MQTAKQSRERLIGRKLRLMNNSKDAVTPDSFPQALFDYADCFCN